MMKSGVNKKVVWAFFGIVAVVTFMLVSLILLRIISNQNWSCNCHVEIEDGELSVAELSQTMELKRAGEYVIHTKWWPEEEPGYITGLVITDPDGNEVIAETANKMFADHEPTELKAGKYTIRASFFTDAEQVNDFLVAHGYDPISEEERNDLNHFFIQNGKWDVNYEVRMESKMGRYSMVIGLVCGLVIGLLAGAIVLFLSHSNSSDKDEFDERQLMLQYKSLKYGFYLLIDINILYVLLSIINVKLPFHPAEVMTVAVVASLLVTIVYNIWKDSYFANNVKYGVRLGAMVLAGIFNLVMGIMAFVNGDRLSADEVSLGLISLCFSVFVFAILFAMGLKKIFDERETEE